MQTNPIMERIVRLSEQWDSVLKDEPELRVVCWGGSSFTEYNMIKGFVMFQMSEESTLDDIFILCGKPFDSETALHYGDSTGFIINDYIGAWNQDEEITAKVGKIEWKYENAGEHDDISNFVENINKLADYFIPEETGIHLVVAIMPGNIRNFDLYLNWMKDLLSLFISPKVRFMLYDRADARLLDGLSEKFPLKFKYVIPDMDLGGAIHEVLESTKQERENPEDKDAITFQQHLIRLTQAVAEGNQNAADKQRRCALEIAEARQWPHLQAIVHYFMYSLSMAQKEYRNAEDEINLAISTIELAIQSERKTHLLSYCEYLMSKALLFLVQEKYEKAVTSYDEGLVAAVELDNQVLLIGIFQMKGICFRLADMKTEAWDSFVSGWELVEKQEELITHDMYKYYAIEMLKVNANGDSKQDYKNQFEELWGREWDGYLDRELKENKHEYKIFNQ